MALSCAACNRASRPAAGRMPRSKAASRDQTCCRCASRSAAIQVFGCFNKASKATGAKPSAWQARIRRNQTATAPCAKGLPALSSTLISQRRNSAATRRANLRSRVTSAAVLSGVCKVSRINKAMTPASLCISGVSTICSPSNLCDVLCCIAQSAVASAGTIARCNRSRRVLPVSFCRSSSRAKRLGQGRTASRSISI